MKKLGILLSATVGMVAAIGTKAVNAKPMTRHEYYDFRGWQPPENENGADEGYLVEYQDGEPNTTEYKGYVSWSPKAQFDNAYQDVTKGVSFGHAIELLKGGYRVAREGWNGKKQYIQLASGISYKAPTGDIVNCEHDAIGNMAVAFVGTSGVQMGWLASQADMLAEDWIGLD